LGGIGATTRLFPALTLGCGAVGGSSTSNNIGPMDVINIKRVAFGTKELEEIRQESQSGSTPCCSGAEREVTTDFIQKIVEQVMQEFLP
jgi:hypothetical protein